MQPHERTRLSLRRARDQAEEVKNIVCDCGSVTVEGSPHCTSCRQYREDARNGLFDDVW